MTLIKKPYDNEKNKATFDTMMGITIIVIVLVLVAIFFPLLIIPFLK